MLSVLTVSLGMFVIGTLAGTVCTKQVDAMLGDGSLSWKHSFRQNLFMWFIALVIVLIIGGVS